MRKLKDTVESIRVKGIHRFICVDVVVNVMNIPDGCRCVSESTIKAVVTSAKRLKFVDDKSKNNFVENMIKSLDRIGICSSCQNGVECRKNMADEIRKRIKE